MTVKPTRTLNPLPFGDLEPHRFEDMIRQLAYDFRQWKSLEAIGKSGSDEGIDIRAFELLQTEVSDDDDDTGLPQYLERLWIFQCKREKNLPPAKVRKLVIEAFAGLDTPPHGFILAAACDISKQARDAFREEMITRGVEEFFIWAKGELEDALFQPKNDHLLFAYFGIALQPRRRNLSTVIRAEVAKKKQLKALLGEEDNGLDGTLVLLRDPTDERYPNIPDKGEVPARWLLCRALSLRQPGFLTIMEHEYLAAITLDGRWDAILDHDVLHRRNLNDLENSHAWGVERDRQVDSAFAFWNEYIPEYRRVYLYQPAGLPLDRIIAIDPLGDGFHPIPHILCDIPADGKPLTRFRPFLGRLGPQRERVDIEVIDSKRSTIFPIPLPSEDDPPLEEFDDTLPGPHSLSTEAADKLQELLPQSGVENQNRLLPADLPSWEQKQNEGRSTFFGWRTSIGLPVFSAFAQKLKHEGHEARVIAKPEEVSIELRVRLANPPYRLRGHVRISNTHFENEWTVNTWPHQQARDHRTIYEKANAATTPQQLEAFVLSMLERLKRS